MRSGREHEPECPRPKMVVTTLDGVSGAMEVATHEALEFVACEMGLRYRPSMAYEQTASDCYFFAFNHNQLTELASRVGNFLWQISKDVESGVELLREVR